MRNPVRITLSGYMVGPIYWPVGEEFFLPLTIDVTRERGRIVFPDGQRATLRDVVCRALAEKGGDFSGGPVIAAGTLTVSTTVRRGSSTYIRRRTWDLSAFPSIADRLHLDPAWSPSDGDDLDRGD